MDNPSPIARSLELYERAKQIVPGGTQLLSRRPLIFAPGVAPIFAERGKGSRIWDVDGNEYLDFGMSVSACILGYADDVVNDAVRAQIDRGVMYSLNHPAELELAELLCRTIPCAEMVRFAKGGGEACAIAVRIARGVGGGLKVQRPAGGKAGRSCSAQMTTCFEDVRLFGESWAVWGFQLRSRGVYCNVDQWIEIRRRVLNREISKRQACQEYALHWQTLKKILSQPVPPERREPGPPRPSKLDPFRPALEAMLDSDRQSHRKQRHTAWRMFERLRDEHGYDGGYTLVKDAVRELKLSRREVFLPLKHDPGEAQVDFGYCDVHLAGVRQQVAMFVLTLPYCDAVYCQVFPRECSEVFLEGHVRAFRFFGGVPRRISYDNTKVAVAKIVGDRERERTKEFQRLVGHFLFEPHFCLVRRPNEKGHVERLLDYARHRCLVPPPTVNSLEALNQRLEAWCLKDLEQTARKQSVPKLARLSDDQGAFLPIPEQDFEARRVAPGQADSLSLVTFDRNQYSVPTQYAHRDVMIVAGIEDVRIVFEDRLIAQHRRCWDRDQTYFEPIHYLALLERKPGGFDFAKPLAGWELPVSFGILRRLLEADLGSRGTREFIKVLRLLERHSLSALKAAVETALELGTTSADAVRLIVDASQEPPIGLFSLDGRPQLKLVRVEQTYIAAYQSLLTTSVRTEVSP